MVEKARMRVLTEAGVKKIHGAVLRLLSEHGVQIQDEDAVKRLRDLGCGESDDGYTLFGEEIVHRALETIPPAMTLYDRDGRKAVDTGDATPRFGPGLNCVDVLDYRTDELRPCLLEDVRDAARLCERLPNIDMAANLGNPGDAPFEEQAMAGVRAVVENTKKPLAFIAHNEKESGEIWRYLADVAGGWDALAERPFGLDLTGPTSPFKLKRESSRRLRFAAAKRLPVVCYPCLFPGVTGPMTIAGAVAQSSAEILAGLVVHQMENPGAPALTGSAVVPMDLRTVNLSYGAPEYAMVGLAAVEYFESLGVPTWIGAGCTDSHAFDAQAVSEAAMGMLSAAFSGTAFIHNLGFMSSGKTGSLEMLVLCDELAAMVRRMAGGVPVDEDSLGVEASLSAGGSGKFLTHPHTIRHVDSGLWIPSLFHRFPATRWSEAGAKTTRDVIREKLNDLLDRI